MAVGACASWHRPRIWGRRTRPEPVGLDMRLPGTRSTAGGYGLRTSLDHEIIDPTHEEEREDPSSSRRTQHPEGAFPC